MHFIKQNPILFAILVISFISIVLSGVALDPLRKVDEKAQAGEIIPGTTKDNIHAGKNAAVFALITSLIAFIGTFVLLAKDFKKSNAGLFMKFI